jgi:hypothetical protein
VRPVCLPTVITVTKTTVKEKIEKNYKVKSDAVAMKAR